MRAFILHAFSPHPLSPLGWAFVERRALPPSFVLSVLQPRNKVPALLHIIQLSGDVLFWMHSTTCFWPVGPGSVFLKLGLLTILGAPEIALQGLRGVVLLSEFHTSTFHFLLLFTWFLGEVMSLEGVYTL